jgi:hypothetical protein
MNKFLWFIAELREEMPMAQSSQGKAMEQGCTVMHTDEDEKAAALEGPQAQVQGTGARASKGIALQCLAPAP